VEILPKLNLMVVSFLDKARPVYWRPKRESRSVRAVGLKPDCMASILPATKLEIATTTPGVKESVLIKKERIPVEREPLPLRCEKRYASVFRMSIRIKNRSRGFPEIFKTHGVGMYAALQKKCARTITMQPYTPSV
jgi:hypothetical protein